MGKVKCPGAVDVTGNKLTLHTEGPNMAVQGKTAKYKEIIEFKSDNHRVFTSHRLVQVTYCLFRVVTGRLFFQAGIGGMLEVFGGIAIMFGLLPLAIR
jgi:hypothetical protein